VGCEASVREWAMRQGWGGRPVPTSQAQGMLVAALAVLAAHYGLDVRRSLDPRHRVTATSGAGERRA
jgi:hypothetical protein